MYCCDIVLLVPLRYFVDTFETLLRYLIRIVPTKSYPREYQCQCHDSMLNRRTKMKNARCWTAIYRIFQDGALNVTKSARAARRLGNVKYRRAMFYLDRRGDAAAAKYDSPPPSGEENFGWWLSHWKLAVSPGSRRDVDHRSSGSSASMLSCIDSDDLNWGTFVQEPLDDGRQDETCEKIELRTFAQDDLDIELIERDAEATLDNWPTIVINDEYNARNESKSEAVRCSLERLIRREEYRIPAPSSQCSSRTRRGVPEVEGYRARLSCSLIDPERIGRVQPRTIPKAPCTKTYTASSHVVAGTKSTEDLVINRDRQIRNTETISSKRSNCEKLNFTWEDCNGPDVRLLTSLATSGIQSYDYNLDVQSDTPMCLCDELAIASKDRRNDYVNNRGIIINEVASILEDLQNDPEKATVLLEEEDRFCDCRSSHDQLTRLALTIETDAEEEVPAVLDDPNNWLRQLRDKIERLQHGHKEIRGDIRGLRGDFQCDERKISDVSNDTVKLRGEIRELRYLDDLLTLVQGELTRISRRNWPFVLGNSGSREEINLII